MRIARCFAVALVGVVACQAGTEANLVDVSGRWEFTETLTDVTHRISCADTGFYEIVQTGDRFAGTYFQRGLCQTPQGLVNNTDSGTVDGGRVVGRTIRFMVTANCEYEGSATGLPAEVLTGRGACVLQDVDRTLTFNGTWSARR